MAAKNRANGPDPLPLNGTEQQQTDLFQNLEKLIASAVSICRLDGSVQCQIGGLITVIEELQRLLRHSFAENKRLERKFDDQKHTFTNTITNLHYRVKEVQSSVESLKYQSEEALKSKEGSISNQEDSVNETLDDELPPQVSLVDESYGYEEESDGSIGLSQYNEEPASRQDSGKEDITDVNSKKDGASGRVSHETTSKNTSSSLRETATSTSEERESALRILRSALSKSDGSDTEKPKGNHRLKTVTKRVRIEEKSNRSILSSTKSRNSKSPLVFTNQRASPKTPLQNTKVYRKGTPPTKQFLNRTKNKARSSKKPTGKIQRSPQKVARINKVKSLKTPVKKPISASKRKSVVFSKIQRKGNLSKKNTTAKSPKKNSPMKLKSDVRNPGKHSLSPKAKFVNTSNTKLSKANERLSKESKESKASPVPGVENPMDKYINLDFLLNANQLMSELVTDPDSEEGTLDTASDIERRNVVDLAKLYRLRVRMAGKCEGDFPVALIKGRESSLPVPGQVDKLLYKMTHAMAIRQQVAKTKEATKKHKLSDSGNRRNMASPAKKRRV